MGLLVMYGEVIPYGKKFSECISWAINIRKPVNRGDRWALFVLE